MKTSDAFRRAFLTHPNACSNRSCSLAAAGRSDWGKHSINGAAESQGVSQCASIDDSLAQMLVSSPDAADNAFRGAFRRLSQTSKLEFLSVFIFSFCSSVRLNSSK